MNSIVFIMLASLLSAAALFVVAYPILVKAGATRPAASSAQETLDELLAQRDAVFQALRELSFDRRVGKITAEDFNAFEANLKQVAADTLRALDRWEAEADDTLEQIMERDIAARRASLTAAGRACPACSRAVSATDLFCGACGATLPAAAALTAVGNACPNCGRPADAEDRFCAGCGQSLAHVAG